MLKLFFKKNKQKNPLQYAISLINDWWNKYFFLSTSGRVLNKGFEIIFKVLNGKFCLYVLYRSFLRALFIIRLRSFQPNSHMFWDFDYSTKYWVQQTNDNWSCQAVHPRKTVCSEWTDNGISFVPVQLWCENFFRHIWGPCSQYIRQQSYMVLFQLAFYGNIQVHLAKCSSKC